MTQSICMHINGDSYRAREDTSDFLSKSQAEANSSSIGNHLLCAPRKKERKTTFSVRTGSSCLFGEGNSKNDDDEKIIHNSSSQVG